MSSSKSPLERQRRSRSRSPVRRAKSPDRTQASSRKLEKLWWCKSCSLRQSVTKIDRGMAACRTPENDGFVEYHIYELCCKTCEHSIGEYSWPRWKTEKKDEKKEDEAPQSPQYDGSKSPDYAPGSPTCPGETPKWPAESPQYDGTP